MLPEITIKISFAPAPGGGTASTGASVEIAPPPPQVQQDSGASFADVPPPPAALPVEDAVPPAPNTEGTKDVSEEADKSPPPSRSKGSRSSK